jgi:histidine triad (HIT) family protein
MADTILNKIVRGEVPSHKVFENDAVLAFLDIHPIAKGHTLVVPKVEAETIFDLTGEQLSSLMQGVELAMKRIQDVLHPDGFTVGWNHGRAGGQAIPQVHVHILQRWYDDGGRSIHAVVDHPGNESVENIATLFMAS